MNGWKFERGNQDRNVSVNAAKNVSTIVIGLL